MPLRVKREATGLNQRQVAERLGISNTTVSMWETGKSLPRGGLLPKLAALYRCTVDELLDGERKYEDGGQK